MQSITKTALHLLPQVMLASLISVLTACGGGSGSDTSNTTTPATTGGATTTTQVDSTCGFSNFQAEMLARINAYRAAGAVCGATAFPAAASVSWNGQLQAAATVMASDMARTGLRAHIGSDGSTFGSRIATAGYAYIYAGENISWGYGSIQGTVDGWMASTVHCQNMMKPEFREIGASCVRNGAGDTNFALEFGAR